MPFIRLSAVLIGYDGLLSIVIDLLKEKQKTDHSSIFSYLVKLI